ncbi:prepilin-type N-terminal cleavage/methylation domain-containing protein [Candidatus Omnitrophota bacterium]
MKKNKRHAFTLIELLVASAILCVISLAIYATFNNGIKIWQKINRDMPEENVDIFFERFSSDLRNAFRFKGIGFSGGEYRLGFPTLINSPRLEKTSVGQAIYFYDPLEETVTREERGFSQVYSGETGVIKQALESVESLRFQYYFYDSEEREYTWQDGWLKEGMPLAVRIELEFDNGIETIRFTKTVTIPVAS